MPSPPRRALLLQLASVAASACSVILAKISLESLALAPFLLVFAASSVLMCLPWADAASLRRFLGLRIGWYAMASNAAGLSAFYFGLTGLDPGTHSFLSRSYVAFGFVFSSLLFHERFGPTRLALAVLFIASALLAGAPARMTLAHWLRAAATLFAAACFALNYALLRMAPANIAPTTPILLYNATLVPIALVQFGPAGATQGMTLVAIASAVACAALAVLSLHWYFSSAKGLTFFMSTALRSASPFFVALLAQSMFPMALSVPNLVGVLSMPGVLLMSAAVEYRRPRRPTPGQSPCRP